MLCFRHPVHWIHHLMKYCFILDVPQCIQPNRSPHLSFCSRKYMGLGSLTYWGTPFGGDDPYVTTEVWYIIPMVTEITFSFFNVQCDTGMLYILLIIIVVSIFNPIASSACLLWQTVHIPIQPFWHNITFESDLWEWQSLLFIYLILTATISFK